MSQHVAMHYDDLFNALRKATENFLAAADGDNVLAARLEEASSFQYISIPDNVTQE